MNRYYLKFLIYRTFLSDFRYLQLEDCGCNVDMQDLDRSLDTDIFMEEHKSITLKKCPNFTCQKPIIKTKRYKNLTLKLFKDIGHIKRKVISQLIEITKPSKKLLRNIEESLAIQRNDIVGKYFRNICV